MAVAEVEIKLRNKQGLHARPAAMIVRTALRFRSEIRLRSAGTIILGGEVIAGETDDCDAVDAKSIMGVMTGAFESGARVVIHADGEDAAEAVAALVALFKSGFGDD